MSSLFAFLHHVAAFVLFAALVLEFVLIRDPLTLQAARRLQRVDMVFGIAAGVVLTVGLLRVFHFEKGAGYYFASVPFLAKLSLFVIVGLLSIYPTLVFLSWRKATRTGRAPEVDARTMQRVRSILHWELVGIALLILCAALMARGVGMLA